MKYLTLKPDAVRIEKSGKVLSTAAVVRSAVMDVGSGIKFEEMRQRNRVLDALEKAGEDATVLALEDADAKVLQRCCASASWTLCQSDLLACLESIQNMPSAPVAAVADQAAA